MSQPLDPEKRGRLEPSRIGSTTVYLARLGWKVEEGPSAGQSFRVTSPARISFVFWPYSGWWQAVGIPKTAGRGFKNMLKTESRISRERSAAR